MLKDITKKLENGIYVYPGDPEFSAEKICDTKNGDICTVTSLSFGAHTGTHIDPPAHVYSGKATLDALPPEQFIGKALVIDCRSIKHGGHITLQHITAYGAKANAADFLLFNLGWDKYWVPKPIWGSIPA